MLTKALCRQFPKISGRRGIQSMENSLKEFFILIPDLPNANRADVRPRHLAQAAASNFYKFGGAYLDNHPGTEEEATDQLLSFRGSAAIVVATSEEEVRKKLLEDPYVIEGVWDIEKAKIWNFKTAVSAAS